MSERGSCQHRRIWKTRNTRQDFAAYNIESMVSCEARAYSNGVPYKQYIFELVTWGRFATSHPANLKCAGGASFLTSLWGCTWYSSLNVSIKKKNTNAVSHLHIGTSRPFGCLRYLRSRFRKTIYRWAKEIFHLERVVPRHLSPKTHVVKGSASLQYWGKNTNSNSQIHRQRSFLIRGVTCAWCLRSLHRRDTANFFMKTNQTNYVGKSFRMVKKQRLTCKARSFSMWIDSITSKINEKWSVIDTPKEKSAFFF